MSNKNKIFIGGTGRCGTTVLGWALEEIDNTAYFIEPLIIMSSGGLLDLLNDRISFEAFSHNTLTRFRAKMFYGFNNIPHCRKYNIDSGFYSKDSIQILLDTLANNININGIREFIHSYIDLGIKYLGCDGFVYKTPNLIGCADGLQKLYNDMTFIHIIREPKDICSSVITYNWGPTDAKSFIKWYNRHMNKALDVYKSNTYNNYIVISFEDLIKNPEYTITEILGSIGITGSEVIKRCTSHFDIKEAHISRHSDNINKEDIEAINATCLHMYNEWLSIARAK